MSIFLGLTLVLGAPHSQAETGIGADGGKNLTPAFRECFGDTRMHMLRMLWETLV